MPLTPQYLDKEQPCLMKEGGCFNCKKKGYITYNCPKKRKIATISKDFIEDNSS